MPRKDPLPVIRKSTPNRTPTRNASKSPGGTREVSKFGYNSDPRVSEMVLKIFAKYDTNKSGSLSRKETLVLVNDVLMDQGKRPATVS